jgi:hypothetical protein
MARATTPRRSHRKRTGPQSNDERARRLLRQAIALLEAGQLSSPARTNADDEGEDPLRRLGSPKRQR